MRRRPDRRRWLLAVAGAAATRVVAAEAPPALPAPVSMALEAATAVRRGEPLVLLVNLAGCPYCEQVRRAYLVPLRKERGGVVQIDLGSPALLTDFDQQRRSHDAFAQARQATFTPTVLFLDDRGAEVAERLVGFPSADFYGGYLEQRLETARRAIAATRR